MGPPVLLDSANVVVRNRNLTSLAHCLVSVYHH